MVNELSFKDITELQPTIGELRDLSLKLSQEAREDAK